MTERVKLECDNCECTAHVIFDPAETDETAPIYCPFCGDEIIMVEELDDEEDESWIEDERDGSLPGHHEDWE